MEKPVRNSDDDKWQAVVNCDKSCDGLFFYAVKTTGVFCRPSCRVKTPRRENVVFFSAPHHAMAAGFRPCKKCRPELIVFEPDLELVRTATEIFKQNYHREIELSEIARQLGVSVNHFIRLFKQRMGITPAQFVTTLRVDKAVKLLEQTDVNILDIAYTTGFRSISNFYKCFTAQIGHTPSAYRKSRGDS